MIVITEGELLSIKDTLSRCYDEFEQLTEECDAFFNSGALEGVEESLEIVEALLSSKHITLEEVENENTSTDT